MAASLGKIEILRCNASFPWNCPNLVNGVWDIAGDSQANKWTMQFLLWAMQSNSGKADNEWISASDVPSSWGSWKTF